MISKAFLERIFSATNMQRWNDKLRPIELRELDKQAHKMIIAYMLGKFQEEDQNIDWIRIIEGGIFEFLQRLVVTDLKPQLFHKIENNSEEYRQLNDWVFKNISQEISSLENGFSHRFKEYIYNTEPDVNKDILKAAHFYATKWEFDIIERIDPDGYEIHEIKNKLVETQEKFYYLEGIKQLALYTKYRDFIDLCGQLRFQVRWSSVHMVPRTSVLGHMLLVAILSYLFSLEMNACNKRRKNNFFTGLFHDLPEILTKDIKNPIKRLDGISEIIEKYQKEEMNNRIYSQELIPEKWHNELHLFTSDEFKSIINRNGNIEEKNSDEISKSFNEDKYDPRDGEIVQVADELTAFIEAYLTLEHGIKSAELEEVKTNLKSKYRNKEISGILLGRIYADFN